jgi:hypothetical protein
VFIFNIIHCNVTYLKNRKRYSFSKNFFFFKRKTEKSNSEQFGVKQKLLKKGEILQLRNVWDTKRYGSFLKTILDGRYKANMEVNCSVIVGRVTST